MSVSFRIFELHAELNTACMTRVRISIEVASVMHAHLFRLTTPDQPTLTRYLAHYTL